MAIFDLQAPFFRPACDKLGRSHPSHHAFSGNLSLNKTELITAIAADTDLSKADAGRMLDSALENLTRALARGETVQLFGFGNFTVASRAERTGRNPSTGEPMTIKASKAPKFTAAKALKDAINVSA